MPRTKTIAALEQELADKKKQLQELEARRETLASQLADVDSRIEKLQGQPQQKKAAAKPRRARRKTRRRGQKWPNLKNALAAVLKGQGPVKAADAARMVQDAGYRTTAKTFAATVSRTLSADPRFRRVSRGVYALEEGQ